MQIPVYQDGVQTGTMTVPDTRPVQEHRDAEGRLLAYHQVFESKPGVITYKLLGEVPARMHATCLLAPTRGTSCVSSAVLPPLDLTSEASRNAVAVAVTEEMKALADALAGGQCPVHNPAAAPLTAHDVALLFYSESAIRDLVGE